MPRRFPAPWTVEKIAGGFKVLDANGPSARLLLFTRDRERRANRQRANRGEAHSGEYCQAIDAATQIDAALLIPFRDCLVWQYPRWQDRKLFRACGASGSILAWLPSEQACETFPLCGQMLPGAAAAPDGQLRTYRRPPQSARVVQASGPLRQNDA